MSVIDTNVVILRIKENVKIYENITEVTLEKNPFSYLNLNFNKNYR